MWLTIILVIILIGVLYLNRNSIDKWYKHIKDRYIDENQNVTLPDDLEDNPRVIYNDEEDSKDEDKSEVNKEEIRNQESNNYQETKENIDEQENAHNKSNLTSKELYSMKESKDFLDAIANPNNHDPINNDNNDKKPTELHIIGNTHEKDTIINNENLDDEEFKHMMKNSGLHRMNILKGETSDIFKDDN